MQKEKADRLLAVARSLYINAEKPEEALELLDYLEAARGYAITQTPLADLGFRCVSASSEFKAWTNKTEQTRIETVSLLPRKLVVYGSLTADPAHILRDAQGRVLWFVSEDRAAQVASRHMEAARRWREVSKSTLLRKPNASWKRWSHDREV